MGTCADHQGKGEIMKFQLTPEQIKALALTGHGYVEIIQVLLTTLKNLEWHGGFCPVCNQQGKHLPECPLQIIFTALYWDYFPELEPFWSDVCATCGYTRGQHYLDDSNPEKVSGCAEDDFCRQFVKREHPTTKETT
jgi:hypothetical protein